MRSAVRLNSVPQPAESVRARPAISTTVPGWPSSRGARRTHRRRRLIARDSTRDPSISMEKMNTQYRLGSWETWMLMNSLAPSKVISVPSSRDLLADAQVHTVQLLQQAVVHLLR